MVLYETWSLGKHPYEDMYNEEVNLTSIITTLYELTSQLALLKLYGLTGSVYCFQEDVI